MDVANDDGNPFMSEASLPQVAGAAAAPIDDPLLFIVSDPPPPPGPSSMQHRLTAVTSWPRPAEVKRFSLPSQAVIQTVSLIGAGVIVGVAITLVTISPGSDGARQASSGVMPVLVATSLSERSHVPFPSFGSPEEPSIPVLSGDVAPLLVASPLVENTAMPPPQPETRRTEVLAPPSLVAEAPRQVDGAIPPEVRPAAAAPSGIKPAPVEVRPAPAEVTPTPAEVKPTPAAINPLPSAATRSTDSARVAAEPVMTRADRPVSSEPVVTPADRPVSSEPVVTPVERPVPSEPVIARGEPPVVSELVVTPAQRPSVSPSSPAATANAAAAISDRQAVDGLLNVYRESYTRRDASLLAAVWRGLEVDKLARAFESLATQELKFYRCKVSMEDARATASCLGRLVFVPRVGAPYPRERGLTWAFEFSRHTGQWLIERVKIE